MPGASVETSKHEISSNAAPQPHGNPVVDAVNLAPCDKSGLTLPEGKKAHSPCGLLSPEESPAFESPMADEQEEVPQGPRNYRSQRMQYLAHHSKDNRDQGQGDRLARIVNSTPFEVGAVLLILLNCMSMAAEAQYTGYNVGYDLGYRKYNTSAAERYPWAQTTLSSLETIFTIIFLVEFLLRIAAYKQNLCKHPMLAFDMVLILMSCADFGTICWLVLIRQLSVPFVF